MLVVQRSRRLSRALHLSFCNNLCKSLTIASSSMLTLKMAGLHHEPATSADITWSRMKNSTDEVIKCLVAKAQKLSESPWLPPYSSLHKPPNVTLFFSETPAFPQNSFCHHRCLYHTLSTKSDFTQHNFLPLTRFQKEMCWPWVIKLLKELKWFHPHPNQTKLRIVRKSKE